MSERFGTGGGGGGETCGGGAGGGGGGNGGGGSSGGCGGGASVDCTSVSVQPCLRRAVVTNELSDHYYV